jgi:integrase
MTTDLALQALLAAVWRRKPTTKVTIHSDQGSQFTSREWQLFLSQHNLEASMSRRGNCHDNAVAESFFQLLKRERIRRRTYLTRETARQDLFEYIETFYNPKRKHTNNGMLSPVDFENRQQKLNKAGVQETRGTSLGFSEFTIAALLGHAPRGVTQRYIHIDDALRMTADRIACEMAALFDVRCR